MRTESVFTVIFVVGLLFKLLHWPGGSMFIILSLSVLAMLYFPFGFFFLSDKNLRDQNLGLSIITGMMLSTLVCSIAFCVMDWPGANAMFIIGGISTLATLGVTLAQRQKNNDETLKRYYDRLGIRQVFFIVVGFIAFVWQF